MNSQFQEPVCKHYGDDCTGTPADWSGSLDPTDPDNFWIDDATNERVNAATGERTTALTASDVYANITGKNDPANLGPIPPTASDDVRCTIETLCPDDAIRRCILRLGHVGFCDGGVR